MHSIQLEISKLQKRFDKLVAGKVELDLSKTNGLSHRPRKIFFTCGVGKAKEKLQSFEHALRNAGIAHFNLVRVSSILPPNCQFTQKSQALEDLKPGQIVFCVMADISTDEPNRLIASSIGLAVPAQKDHYGYISEHHTFGMTEKKAGDYSEDLAATMLASTLGVQFDPYRAYDERKEQYKMSGKIVKTRSITKTALGDKNGLWTTVVAAAVFVP
ncbi:arginine decarboxylase, pyruvoyl-dependent [Candidatus Woesearchaeota archaeon]|nr:arginine decarboxylase, pyruvoyl-dependent [Candidatus Woesearchaeota archaeon]